MSSAWGGSWGTSWGPSWGAGWVSVHHGYNDLTLPFAVDLNDAWNTLAESIETLSGEYNTLTWTVIRKPNWYWNDDK